MRLKNRTIFAGRSNSAVLEEVTMINHGGDTVNIPRLKDPKHPINAVIDKMNAAILEEFGINSYNDSDSVNLWFQDVKTTISQDDGILYLEYEGVSLGAYPIEGTWGIFFDMNTGDTLSTTEFPCHSFFTLDGFDRFIRKYWRAGAEKAFVSAGKCADWDADGYKDRLYDMEYEADSSGRITLSLPYTIFPHVVRGCSPEYSVTLSENQLKPYLNDLGKTFLTRSYLTLSPLKQFLRRKAFAGTIPSTIFIFGDVQLYGEAEGGGNFTMALQKVSTDSISGFYYYDGGRRIQLKGKKEGITATLSETKTGKPANTFHLVIDTSSFVDDGFAWYDMNQKNFYVGGKWIKADNSKEFPLKIMAIEGTTF